MGFKVLLTMQPHAWDSVLSDLRNDKGGDLRNDKGGDLRNDKGGHLRNDKSGDLRYDANNKLPNIMILTKNHCLFVI